VETGTQVMDRLPDGLPYGFLALPQYETERILERALAREPGGVRRSFICLTAVSGSGVEVPIAW
jgi:hypothetical protein